MAEVPVLAFVRCLRVVRFCRTRWCIRCCYYFYNVVLHSGTIPNMDTCVREPWEVSAVAWALASGLAQVLAWVQVLERVWVLALASGLVSVLAWALVRVPELAVWELFQSSVILETKDLHSL